MNLQVSYLLDGSNASKGSSINVNFCEGYIKLDGSKTLHNFVLVLLHPLQSKSFVVLESFIAKAIMH